MTLRDLAPVRALAAERARDVHDAAVRAIKARHFGSYAQSLIDALPPMWVDVDAHLDLLTDISRPDSRDAIARLVAAKVGADLSGGIVYTLTQRTEGGRKIKTWVVCDCNGDDFPVLADTKIMDPIEALQAMALAVLA